CTGETADVDGLINVVFHITQNAAGGLVLNGEANLQHVTAVGHSSGIRYHIVGRSVLGFGGPFVATPGGALVSNFVLNQLWASEGSSVNLFAHFTLVFVINPNGDLTANVEKIDFDCKG
ncbi:MAG: hypothetical protein ACRDIC_12380, partial [bacterium]